MWRSRLGRRFYRCACAIVLSMISDQPPVARSTALSVSVETEIIPQLLALNYNEMCYCFHQARRKTKINSNFIHFTSSDRLEETHCHFICHFGRLTIRNMFVQQCLINGKIDKRQNRKEFLSRKIIIQII
uniref:Secreted protein n=1 Tax=Trichogramma kaykai TaxID=54128 RepID=A0ABD2WCU3_9HYME